MSLLLNLNTLAEQSGTSPAFLFLSWNKYLIIAIYFLLGMTYQKTVMLKKTTSTAKNGKKQQLMSSVIIFIVNFKQTDVS